MLGFSEVLQNAIYFISLYYTIFWLLVFVDHYSSSSEKKPRTPEVTVVVPAYNEEDNVEETLQAVANLDYPKERMSVIFVDDGSTDNTLKIARETREKLLKRHRFREFLVLTQKNQGKYMAMNNALKHVKTPFFATLDADSFPKPDSLKHLMGEFDSPDIGAVSPILKVHRPRNKVQMMQWFEYVVNHFYKSVIAKANAIHVTPGPLSVYRADVVKGLGGFTKGHKTEDMEIAMRIQKNHYRIVQCNNAFVYTKAPYTLGALYRQRLRWNYGTFKNLVDYRKMIFNRQYGDFGMFQLPTILVSGIMGITILWLIMYDLWKGLKPAFDMLQLYHFNLYRLIAETRFGNIIWLDMDVKSLVTFGGFFALTVLIMWLALKMHNEKYPVRTTVSFVFYIFFYYIFLAYVWLNVFKDVLLNKERAWKK